MGNVSDAVIQFLSSSKTRMAILGLLVLTTGVFTTIYLVSQQQDIRQRASGPVCDPNLCYAATTADACAAVGDCCNPQGIKPGGTVGCAPVSAGGGGTQGTCSGACRKPGDGAGGCSGVWVGAEGSCTGAGESCQKCEVGTMGSGGTTASTDSCSGQFGRAEGCICGTNQQCASGKCVGAIINPDGTGTAGTCGPSSTGGTGGTASSSSGSTHCAETCGPQGKNYSCPSFLGGRTCSNSNFLGLCTRCETPQATATPTPTQTQTEPTNTPTPTTGPGTPTPTIASVTFTPTPSIDPACAGSTGKQNGCVCDINAHCASGFCGFNNNNEKVCMTDTPTTTLTCDPNTDGVINILDFQWWRDEFTGVATTKVADCFSPNNAVDLQDFQIWREIFITHERQPF